MTNFRWLSVQMTDGRKKISRTPIVHCVLRFLYFHFISLCIVSQPVFPFFWMSENANFKDMTFSECWLLRNANNKLKSKE